MRVGRLILLVASLCALTGCDQIYAALDSNAKPVYGKESGLPVNCRAYVQAAIDGYRSKKFSADEAMSGLERNCGGAGYSWGAR